MIINDIDVSFNLDNRTDYSKFVKAMGIVQRKAANNKSSAIDDADMENFLRGCLKKDEAEQLLADNLISTLAKAFAEFMNQAVDQLDAVLGTYQQTADLVVDTYQKVQDIQMSLDKMPSVPDVLSIASAQ